MKKYIILFLVATLFVHDAFAEEVLTEEQKIEKKIQTQVDSGLGTIKVYLSERGECKDILTNKVISQWYKLFIEDISQPMESRKTVFEQQKAPLQKEIETLKTTIEQKNQELKDKKQAFVDDYIVTDDNDKKLQDIELLKKEILELTSKMNTKSAELKSITTDYESHIYLSKEQITSSYETKILTHCNAWYGKVELTDKKTLEQFESDLSDSLNKAKKTPSKYKKIFDKIDILYVKKPKNVESLYKRLDKVVRTLSKTHKDYELLFELRKHISNLIGNNTLITK